MDRRDFLAGVAAAPLALALGESSSVAAAQTKPATAKRMPIRQSVMASVWTGTKYSFEERCQILSKLGFKGVDLPTREQVPTLKKYGLDRKSTRLNSSHSQISYAVFCLKKKKRQTHNK